MSSPHPVAIGNCKEYKLEYDPHSRKWDVTEATGDHLAMSLLKQAKIS